jgi:hypothetical protein
VGKGRNSYEMVSKIPEGRNKLGTPCLIKYIKWAIKMFED